MRHFNQMKSEKFYLCRGCNTMQNHSTPSYTLRKCKHRYCSQCAIKLINESLSLLNESPKCSHPECNQPLSIKDSRFLLMKYNRFLLPKYRAISLQNASFYRREHCLISGYIRRRVRLRKQIIPHVIMLLVYDYYRLSYHTNSKCIDCKAKGFTYIRCAPCKATGYTTDCKACNETGVYKYFIECRSCNGSGEYRRDYPCKKCHSSGIYRDEACRRCGGSGRFARSRYRYDSDDDGYDAGICYGCKGSGRYKLECNRCDGTGTYEYRGDCNKCSGDGQIQKQTKCRKCKGSGTRRLKCTSCKGDGRVPQRCTLCNGHKQCMILDLVALRQKQSLCVKCNEYYPNDQVFHWDCHHAYCGDCASSFIRHELQLQQRHPQCFAAGCSSKLSVKAMQMMNIFSTRSVSNLQKLIRFQCCICDEMKPENERFVWSHCKHVCCTQCATNTVNRAVSTNNAIPICAHFDAKSLSFCEMPLIMVDMDILQEAHVIHQLSEWQKTKYLTQVQCTQCENGSGNDIVQCDSCCGFGRIETSLVAQSGIYQCRGSGSGSRTCTNCGGHGRNVYSCNKCGGTGKMMAFDFDKLVSEQLRCTKCNHYSPPSVLIKWPNCNHLYCYHCMLPYFQSKVQQNEIPKCISSECGHCEYIGDASFRCELVRNVGVSIKAISKLDLLIYRKDRFECTFCKKWHLNSKVFVFSHCGHKYGRKCIKQYIDEQLPAEESIFNVFKKQQQPKCFHSSCTQYMSIESAIRAGITEYQLQTLTKKIKQRNENCIVM